MVSLTARRVDAIRDALSYRLASQCPGDTRPLKDYREALTWATEQALRRERGRAASLRPQPASPFSRSGIPNAAVGLQLCKFFSGDDLRMCEPVRFTKGAPAVDTVLRRAAISGHVQVHSSGPLPDYFADLLDETGDIIGHVELDADSFRALKGHWMRCKYEHAQPKGEHEE